MIRPLPAPPCVRSVPAAVLVLLAGLTGAGAEAAEVERTRYLMGTTCRVVAVAADESRAVEAIEAAFAEIAAVDRLLSTWRDDSELAVLNRARAGEDQPMSAELASVLDAALGLARDTGGAFDPTVGAILDAWDLRGVGRIPSSDELARARRATGHHHVRLDAEHQRIHVHVPGLRFDAGGFGKGAALDRAGTALRSHGVMAALIDFGGQFLAVGAPPGSAGWRVALADPRDRMRPAVVLELARGSLATSSGGERFVEVEGRRLGHVIDPRTGEPSPVVASATVWAESALEADAWSTALLVLGPVEGARLLTGRGAPAGLHLVPGPTGSRSLQALATPAFALRVVGAEPAVHFVRSHVDPLTR